jgi:mannose-6-phosphate isomerase
MVELFGYKNPNGMPLAEMWMGAHPKASSSIFYEEEKENLLGYIDQNPIVFLGEKCAGKFNKKLPFLFKVLSADSPLSIQSHPNKAQAIAGWARENELGISLSAPNRNYKDDNHKPELVYAITEFHALNGFREYHEIIDFFNLIKGSVLSPLVDGFMKNPTSEGLQSFYYELMMHKDKELLVAEAVNNVMDLLEEKSQDELLIKTFNIVLELQKAYPNDIGVLSPFLINYLILRPGDVMFINSGTLHSYLKGTALELMANSDNVLRGGLTTKHVDIEELLNTTIFKPASFDNIKITPQFGDHDSELLYPTEAEDFQFRISNVNGKELTNQVLSAEILFVLSGELHIRKSKSTGISDALVLKVGQSCFITAENQSYTLSGHAKVARALTPL